MNYPDIESHGVIGNLRTAALVGIDGSVDFFCFPRFDSPSVFLALLDPEHGGHFSISPAGEDMRTRQMYLPDTNVLVTRFMSQAGMAEVTDYMPLSATGAPRSALVRRIHGVRGRLALHVTCAPRFDYARTRLPARLEEGARMAVFGAREAIGPLRLRSTVDLTVQDGDVRALIELGAGDEAAFVMECVRERPSEGDLGAFVTNSFQETMAFWRGWSERSSYRGRWREIVQRSALILKLLSSADHGAIIGAATFGLPEHVGGERNWDYRYCWLRDAAFTVYSLMRLGYTGEAEAFIGWAHDRIGEYNGGAVPQILYAVDGSHVGQEMELPHLAGYRGSRPVRVGNAAAGQLQLDVLGELVDAIYMADMHGVPASIDVWQALSQRIDWWCEHWDQPEEGIWEIRGPRRDFLSGRLLSWVALDRALRMARRFARPAPLPRWYQTRDAIASQILTEFWNPRKQAFVQYRGGETLDAVALLMPMVKFVSANDPRWLSTLEAIRRELTIDGLVARYSTTDAGGEANIDGLQGQEGAFTPCSFWYVECLARAGRVDEARLLFEKILTYANHLGLYAEELGPSGTQLGNFPQALTHLALISAAHALNRVIEEGPATWARGG
ncbi:glycoside hydrolase family 15 protein [Azohydromonas caseinilytica]|uniref:Glycoside hydrolase family 15 protein n=1 Tax=Azohydromonas caseinilytica TaxID=2728836 RepID=A0A848FCR8_9BURK|nr:glycoside hydrolase family 15 protein [Azohydromonas caseinilytica]NML17102.1 glycoside hydrolase family 15 protein [Azohydromonas caseinilytica]